LHQLQRDKFNTKQVMTHSKDLHIIKIE